MATTASPNALGAGTTQKEPSNQENTDPHDETTAPSSNNLKTMFEGISNIRTHRTEANLFQALDKRDLTEDEQNVIDERVALQRKMYAEFERRDKARKIKELIEVCPDISEQEAERALDLCNGNEDDAANALVTDPDFREEIRHAPRQPSSHTNNNTTTTTRRPYNRSNKGGSSSRAATGPRPKIVDPSSLGSSVFVGVFRGKGFSGTASHRPVARGNKAVKAAAAAMYGNDPSSDNEEQEEEEAEEVEVRRTRSATKKGRPTAAAEEEEEEAVVEEEEAVPAVEENNNKETPAVTNRATRSTPRHSTGGPKVHALVVETSQGDVRPATESEIKAASRAVVPSPPAVRSTRPARTAALHAAATFTAVEQGMMEQQVADGDEEPMLRSPMVAMIMNKVEKMQDDDAVAWLKNMNEKTRTLALTRIGGEDPLRAVTLAELIEAAATSKDDEKEEEVNPTEAPAPAMDVDSEATQSEEQPQKRRSTRHTPNKSTAADSDMSGWEDESPAAGGGTASKRPTRAAKSAAVAKGLSEDAPGSAGTRKRQQQSKAIDEDVEEGGELKRARSTEAPAPVAAAATTRPAVATTVGRGKSSKAISKKGHTTRGRVKQKSHKAADLVSAGTLRASNGWFNAGYIFPEGFHSRTLFRSSVSLDALCVHECYVLGRDGQHWPAPTFKVVALDRPDEPIIAKSCTGCWSGILKRINSEIEARRKAGEDLPPPPKTAIAGPEYFGFNQPNIVEAVEALDPDHKCELYWSGKEDREAVAAGLPKQSNGGGGSKAPRAPRAPSTRQPRGKGGRRRRSGGSDTEDDNDEEEEGDETQYMSNRWSAVGRTERYKKRLEENGEEVNVVDNDNPLPGFMDPITLEEVARPAISPYGHVMGAATWKAVLAESNNVCPFTKQPLKWEQCRVLTLHNIELYRDRIIS